LKVYAFGAVAARSPRTTMAVRPGAHPESDPSEWHENGNPVQFTVEFRYGEAEVPSTLGKYMVRQGLAKATRLILPKECRAA
jgi:hypothetical protein